MAKISRTPVVHAVPAAPRPVKALRLGVALCVSFGTHAVLLAMFMLIAPAAIVLSQQDHEDANDPQVLADPQESLPVEMFDVIDPDISGLNTGGEASNDSQRRSEATVPGLDDPRKKSASATAMTRIRPSTRRRRRASVRAPAARPTWDPAPRAASCLPAARLANIRTTTATSCAREAAPA